MISAQEAMQLCNEHSSDYATIISELDSAIRVACSNGKDHITWPVVFTYKECDRQTEAKYKYLYHYLTKLGYKVFQQSVEDLKETKSVRYTIRVCWTP